MIWNVSTPKQTLTSSFDNFVPQDGSYDFDNSWRRGQYNKTRALSGTAEVAPSLISLCHAKKIPTAGETKLKVHHYFLS